MKCIECKKEIPEMSLYCLHCGKKQAATQRAPSRRSNGEGTVHKRKDRKNKPWMALATLKVGTREVIGYYDTASEARAAIVNFKNVPTDKLNITVKELFKEWKVLGYKDKAQGTIDGYNAAWKNIKPIHLYKFRELRTADVQRIIEQLQEKKTIKGEKIPPLGYSSLHKIKALLKLMYDYAVQNDIVNKNYADFIVLPTKQAPSKTRFTDLEIKIIEQNIEKVDYASYILSMCYTGFRISEFLSLTKFNVKKHKDIMVLTGGSKTKSGKNRIVPVHNKIRPIIEKQLSLNGDALFCRLDTGEKMSSNYFRNYGYKQALDTMGIDYKTPHSTRRTFATKMAQANVRPEDLQKILGHADYQVSIDHYINQSASTLKMAVDKIL